MQKLYQTQSQLRDFGEPYSRVKMADQVASDPLVAPFIQQAPKAKSWYLCSRTWDNGINDTMIKYFEEAVNSGDTEALATAAQGVGQTLAQYGLGNLSTR